MGEEPPIWNIYNFTNATVKKNVSTFRVEDHLGSPRAPLPIIIPVTIVYCLIFITGILGNITTCIVISRRTYMQTATNYYLFSLAISDLLSLILGLPQEILSLWRQYPYIFGHVICSLRAVLSEMTSYASILTITAFTVERYIAICHPLFAQTVTSPSRAIKIIICIWVISNISAIPHAKFSTVHYVFHPETKEQIKESAYCGIDLNLRLKWTPLFQFSTFMFFLIPMTIITLLYIRIGLALRMSGLSRTSSDNSNPLNDTATKPRQSRKAVLKMLVAVVIAFFVCWAPFHTQRLLFCYVTVWTPELKQIDTCLYYTSGCLYYFNSTVNPILYNVMSRKYRTAFIETLGCHRGRSLGERNRYSGYSTAMTFMNNRSMWKDTRSDRENSDSSPKRNYPNGACLVLKKNGDSEQNWQITSKSTSGPSSTVNSKIEADENKSSAVTKNVKTSQVLTTVPQSFLKNLKSTETFL